MDQLALTLEPGLAQRYRDLRECFAKCVYTVGLGRVAAAVDVAPSTLSQMLSGERKLDTGVIERYMDAFKDSTPAQFLAARWCVDARTLQEQALAALPEALSHIQALASLLSPKASGK